MKLLLLTLLAQDLPGAQPVPKDAGWLKRHEGFVAEAKRGEAELLLLGDSITDAWRSAKQKELWDAHFAPLKPANFGISGDRTQHLLWRLRNGELDGLKPKAAMLMIGTNNIGQKNPEEPASAAAGVRAIVQEIRTRSPSTKILLLGVFPRGEKPDDPIRAKVKALNDEIRGLDDGSTVRWLDIGGIFLQPDGALSKEIMPDFLHLSPKGYALWAEAVKAPLADLMK